MHTIKDGNCRIHFNSDFSGETIITDGSGVAVSMSEKMVSLLMAEYADMISEELGRQIRGRYGNLYPEEEEQEDSPVKQIRDNPGTMEMIFDDDQDIHVVLRDARKGITRSSIEIANHFGGGGNREIYQAALRLKHAIDEHGFDIEKNRSTQ